MIDRLIAGVSRRLFLANPAHRRCISSPHWTPRRRCERCYACSKGLLLALADGYARIAGKPAATLLHLGPEWRMGWRTLQRPPRARPVVNVVGDPTYTYHQKLDAPLQSDIDALGTGLTGTVHRPTSSADLRSGLPTRRSPQRASDASLHSSCLPDLSWSDADPDAAPQQLPLTTRGGDRRLVSQDIPLARSAEKLTVSIRTVEGYIYRVMTETRPIRSAGAQHVPDG